MPTGCQKVYTFVNLQQGASKRCFRGSDCPQRTAPGRGSGPREAPVAPRVHACARDPKSDGVSIESSSCARHAPSTRESTALVAFAVHPSVDQNVRSVSEALPLVGSASARFVQVPFGTSPSNAIGMPLSIPYPSEIESE